MRRPPPFADEQQARPVSGETFRTKSLPRWRPSGGASLRTYFIARCLFDLPDVYRAW